VLWRCETHGGASCIYTYRNMCIYTQIHIHIHMYLYNMSSGACCGGARLMVERAARGNQNTRTLARLLPRHRLYRNHQHHWGGCVCAECYRYVGCANFFHIHVCMYVYIYMCTEFWHPIERVLPVCGECEFLSYTCMYIRIYIYTCVLNSDSLLIECYQCAGCANFFHVHVYIYVYIHTCV